MFLNKIKKYTPKNSKDYLVNILLTIFSWMYIIVPFTSKYFKDSNFFFGFFYFLSTIILAIICSIVLRLIFYKIKKLPNCYRRIFFSIPVLLLAAVVILGEIHPMVWTKIERSKQFFDFFNLSVILLVVLFSLFLSWLWSKTRLSKSIEVFFLKRSVLSNLLRTILIIIWFVVNMFAILFFIIISIAPGYTLKYYSCGSKFSDGFYEAARTGSREFCEKFNIEEINYAYLHITKICKAPNYEQIIVGSNHDEIDLDRRNENFKKSCYQSLYKYTNNKIFEVETEYE